MEKKWRTKKKWLNRKISTWISHELDSSGQQIHLGGRRLIRKIKICPGIHWTSNSQSLWFPILRHNNNIKSIRILYKYKRMACMCVCERKRNKVNRAIRGKPNMSDYGALGICQYTIANFYNNNNDKKTIYRLRIRYRIECTQKNDELVGWERWRERERRGQHFQSIIQFN